METFFFVNTPLVQRAVNPLRMIERVCDQYQFRKHSLYFILKKIKKCATAQAILSTFLKEDLELRDLILVFLRSSIA